ncbi:glycoside hydrolase family 26 protein [Streptomyces laurentii]|uniref:glycoside hydrolase family 26 protein n=1 Tax=Streptomyces laurentii TaxID=39478 RepID=UPI00367E0FCA
MPQRKRRNPGGWRTGVLTAALLAACPLTLAPPAAGYATPAPGPAPTPATAPAPAPSTPAPASSGTPAPAPAPASVPAAPAAPAPRADPAGSMGAFLESGPAGVARLDRLGDWLGGRALRVAHTYLPGDHWTGIEGPPTLLAPWAGWRARGAGRLLVLNVPMLDASETAVGDEDVRRRLQWGAAGYYDDHFRTLAGRLVALGAPDAEIVLGWEMNGTTYAHRCAPDPTAWKRYWKRIVTAMRAVPGQRFRFDFTPSRGLDANPWTACYPGDDVVDVIGMDSYDQPAGSRFDEHVNEPYGLRAQVDFAALHGKPVSYPEWGLFRNGDNPAYMRSMLEWMTRHRPVYHTITDYCPHGVWQCGANPRSSRVFQQMLYEAEPAKPAPAPTPTAATARP